MLPLLLSNLLHLGLTLVGLMALLGWLHLQERLSGRYLAHKLGWRAVLLTGWLGVPVHELAHLITAKLFGHRIIAWKLFEPDPVSGTLGYVRHAYSRQNLWQVLGTLFIGLAPLALGGLLLSGLLVWMLPPAALDALTRQARHLDNAAAAGGVQELLTALQALVRDFGVALWVNRTWWLPLQLYLGICIASHLCPSPGDLAGAWPGSVLGTILTLGVVALLSSRGVSLAVAGAVLIPLLLLTLATTLFQGLYVSLVGMVFRLRA